MYKIFKQLPLYVVSVSTVCDFQGEGISARLWDSRIDTLSCKGNKLCKLSARFPHSKESGRYHLSLDRDRASSRRRGYVQRGDRRTDHERLEPP